MHEYTIKTIDGVEWAVYHKDTATLEFIFTDDADAQIKIDKFLEELHIAELKAKYPDTWEVELAKEKGLYDEVSLTPAINIPIETVEEM
tara:strand:+ start:87 stop:353 length:267 start_codon:yes stop_codon:yes gene_type:complete